MPSPRFNIGVIGAGNIGTAMAALLSRAPVGIYLAARGARGQMVRNNGIQLNDRGTVITAHPPCETVLPKVMDAVFVCVKSQNLAQAIYSNRAAIGPETLVIPMVNGLPFWFRATSNAMGDIPHLDPDGKLASLLDPKQILGAVLLMTVRMDANEQAISSNTPTLTLGSVAQGTDGTRVQQLIELLETAGVKTDISPDIRQKLLVKLLANVATNPLTALSDATLEEVGKTETLRAVATDLADEFRAWAKSEGYQLPENTWLVDLMIDAGDFPTSMLQDARAGRALELDAICRAPLALARGAGLDMPVLAALITALENTPALPLTDATAALAALQTPSHIPQRISQ